MRILFLTHYFPPEGNAPATRVHAMAKHWVRAGHEVEVITCAPNVPAGILYDGYKNRLLQRETIDGIQVTRVWTYLAANAGFAKRILNYLSFAITGGFAALRSKRPDVVIATSPQPFCGWTGQVVAALRRLPFVLEVRDIWPASILATKAMQQGAAIRILERAMNYSYRTAPQIVTVGDGYARELVALGVTPSRISVIPNGVDTEKFAPRAPDPNLRAKLGIEDKFSCAYVGTVGMSCGLGILIRAAEQLNSEADDSVRFLIVGDGAVRAELEAEATRKNLSNLIFTGRLPQNAIPALLASVDSCLVHLRKAPIFETVLPSKIFEAAAMERPIILGVEGDAARLVSESGGGRCIEPESEGQLLSTIRELQSSEHRRRDMGRDGRSFFTKNYDRSTLAERYLDLLSQVMTPEAEATAMPRETRQDRTVTQGAKGKVSNAQP